MPESTPNPEEKEQPQEGPGQAAGGPESNGAPSGGDLEVIKAELEEERQAKAAAQAALAEKDALISDLQNQLSEAKQASESFTQVKDELTQLKEAHTRAVAKYLDAVKLANPTLPGEVISGSTIDEIDASLAKATTIAGAVKASLEAEAKQARVPAGAPTRGEISLEGLSPREKIAAGIQQKGGTS
jgi:hypothetical protein